MASRGSGRRVRPAVIVRAVLAFGLVFGVGAVVTDAAWTDQEFSTGTFTAGMFGIEGSTDGTTFSDHATSDSAATLTFNANGLYPGEVVAAPWAVRTVAGSIAGTAVLSEPTAPTGNAGLIADLEYRVYADTTSGCTATSTPSSSGEYLAGSATAFVPLTQAPATTAVALPAGANATTAGAPVFYCFQVELSTNAANADQGQTATATWLATGTNS